MQERRSTPGKLGEVIPDYIKSEMPQQYADFFAGLSYLPMATLDSRGRPWVSLLVTKSDDDPSLGIVVSDPNTTDVVAETNAFDPFARVLSQTKFDESGKLFASVGVDFNNRRRNKIAGSIDFASVEEAGKIRMRLNSNQHLGNCPKYITIRTLSYERRMAELAYKSFENNNSALPEEVKILVNRTSTVFLATKHIAEDGAAGGQTDMGLNHRGGAPGFTRIYEEADGDQVTTYLVLPDYSGNRFYQSLGNIETDPQVGLVFPDFTTGDVLYVTGEAENLYDAEAEAIMPRVSLLTRIKVTGVVFVRSGLNLRLVSEEQFSPYNPPVKYLQQEHEQMGHATPAKQSIDKISATLVSVRTISDSIKTFNFDLSKPINAPFPGGFGVFDFSEILDVGYTHMNEAFPQLVNEDYVRTWTLSSAPRFDANTNAFGAANQVSVTVKKKQGGLVSSFLHDNADKMIEHAVSVDFKGTGTGFTCFETPSHGGSVSIPPKMLWIAGGVGITPFMAMWDGIMQIARAKPQYISTDIVLLFSGRDDDVIVLKQFLAQSGSLPENLNIEVRVFQSVSDDPARAKSALDKLRREFSGSTLRLEQRRVRIEDIQAVDDLNNREIYMCGPDSLMAWSDTALSELGVEEQRRHRESFIF